MTQAIIKVTLSDGSSVLKNWEQSYEADAPGLVDAVKQVKQSVNEYLTHLVEQSKGLPSKDKSKPTVEELDEEDEEVEDDMISGLIKNMGTSSENSKRSKQQKNNYSKPAKRRKK